MIRIYLRSIFRTLLQHKGASFLHMRSLSLGLAACLLMALVVRDQRELYQLVPEANRVYRAAQEYPNSAGAGVVAPAPPGFAPRLTKLYESAVHFESEPYA